MTDLLSENTRLRERVKELEGREAFTLSDAARMLSKDDVQGVCPHPELCFDYSTRVRCGPCAVSASKLRGIEIDDTHSMLPEVCKLRRELKTARNDALEEAAQLCIHYDPFEHKHANHAGSLNTAANLLGLIRALKEKQHG